MAISLMPPFMHQWRSDMGLKFGPGFWAARRDWQYQANGGQSLLVTALLLIGMFVAYSILQGIFGYFAYAALFQDWLLKNLADANGMGNFVKGSIVGLTPAALVAMPMIWLATKIANKNGNSGLQLKLPDLGIFGWLLVTGGFAVTVYAFYATTFTVLGIDPNDYAPTADGKSQSGLIEKALADLADEPFLFALAIPGVALIVPIVEELLFRGAIFSALVNSWFGKSGAVLVTSAVWALVHGATAPWLFVGIIFAMGILLGLLLLRFGSLWVTIVCHCVWNALTTLAIFGETTPT